MNDIQEQITASKLFEINSDIFERKIKNVIKETGGIDNETKADILCSFYEKLTYPENKWEREEIK